MAIVVIIFVLGSGIKVTEIDKFFVQVQFQFFNYSWVDCDDYFMISAHNGWLGMATILAYPTIVAFTPVSSLIEGTGDAKSLVTTSDIVADIVARSGLS